MSAHRLRENFFRITDIALSPTAMYALAMTSIFALLIYGISRIVEPLPSDREHIDHFLTHKDQIVALADEIKTIRFDGGIWLDDISTGHPLIQQPERLSAVRERMTDLRIWRLINYPEQACIYLTYLANIERSTHGKDFTDCAPGDSNWDGVHDFTDRKTGQRGRYWRQEYDNGEYVEMLSITEGWYLYYYFHSVP